MIGVLFCVSRGSDLRLTMLTTTEIKYLAYLVSRTLIANERKFGQYDVNESIGALWHFNDLCQSITVHGKMAYMLELEARITTAKDKMSEASAGKYSGGKGSLGSAYNKLNDLVNSHEPYHFIVKSLKKELKKYGVKWSDVVSEYPDQAIPEKYINVVYVFGYIAFAIVCFAILGLRLFTMYL